MQLCPFRQPIVIQLDELGPPPKVAMAHLCFLSLSVNWGLLFARH